MTKNQSTSLRSDAVILDFESGRQRFLMGPRAQKKTETDNEATKIISFHPSHHSDVVPHGDDAA